MPLDPKDVTRLRDMLLWSRKAMFMLGNRSYEELMENEEKRLALVRCVEVIGEAGHEVSLPTQRLLPQVPWHAMYGMRNRLIHDYGNTNYSVVYDVVMQDLPGLASQVAQLLQDHGHTVDR
jgi:uncharacterized protein with HEPN domain